MSQHEVRGGKPGVNEGRRQLIKAAAVAGGAVVAVGALPGEWKKPLATVGGLPAHAQTSAVPNIGVSNLAFLGLSAARELRNRLTVGEVPCDWTFNYDDPLCQVGLDVTVTGTVTMCGQTEPFTKTLLELGARIASGDSCTGVMQFSFPAAVCSPPSLEGTLEIMLSKGARVSEKISVVFALPAVA